MGVRYAKRNLYAEVPQEGVSTGIRTLVGVRGRAVSPIYDPFVDDEDTTTDATEAATLANAPEDVVPEAEQPAGGPTTSIDLALLYADLDSAKDDDEILEVLHEASPEELDAIKERELAGQGRELVLEFDPKADPGEGDEKPEEPLEGYDAMNVKAVQAELKDASEATVKAVKAYEDTHQARKGILEFDPKGGS